MTEQTQNQEDEIEQVKRIVAETIGNNYHNLKFVNSGGMGYIFHANHGAPDGELRALKADRLTMANPRLERYAQRGCGTARESRILASLPDARKHHIVRLLHYFPPNSGISVAEMDHIDGETLEDKLLRQTISPDNAVLALANILDAANYYSSRGVLHRDIKPDNIIIENGTNEAFLVDFGSSSEKNIPQDRNLTTYGHRIIADPLLVEHFTRKKRLYSEDSEMHTLSEIGVRSLTGNYAYRCDPYGGTLSDNQGRSLLNSNGQIDLGLSNLRLNALLESLPKEARRLAPALRRALTLDENLRYDGNNAIAEFTHDFLKATGFSSIEKPRRDRVLSRRSLVFGGLGVIALATVLGGVGAYQATRVRNLEREKIEAGKYEVVPNWKENLGIQNNLVELNSSYYDKTKKSGSETNPKFIGTERGNLLEIYPKVKENPFPKGEVCGGLPRLPGAVYIEGFQKIPFKTWAFPDSPQNYFSEGYTGPPEIDLKIPNLPDGCYTLAVEVYAPIESDFDKQDSLDVYKTLKFREPGRVIARDRIPLIVGKPDVNVILSNIGLGLGETVVFKDINNNHPQHKLSYHFKIPNMGFNRDVDDPKNGYSVYPGELQFPNIDHQTEDMFEYFARDHLGKIVTFGMIPIKSERLGKTNPPYYLWSYGIPGRDYSDRLIELRRKLLPELH